MTHLINNLPQAERSRGLSTYQQIINEGMEKGLDLGIEKGIDLGMGKGIDIGMTSIVSTIIVKQPDYSDAQIADLCGVSVDFVKKVRLSLQ